MSDLKESHLRWSTKDDLLSFRYKFTILDKIKFFIATFTIFPLRLLLLTVVLFFAYLACLLVHFRKEKNKPVTGFRKKYVLPFVLFLSKFFLFSLGFTDIRIHGKKASREEAPILLLIPHSSFFDAVTCMIIAPVCVVSKRVNPFSIHGCITQVCEPVYVDRDDKNSKHDASKAIIDRVTSNEDWPQLALFPEGMISNRKALLMFRKGAFNAGLPVQPMFISYYNDYDTTSWLNSGPSPLTLIWMTMCNLQNRIELTFLKPYVPSCEEKANVSLYAHRVREYILGKVDMMKNNLSYEYFNLTCSAMKNKIPFQGLLSDYMMFHKTYFNQDEDLKKQLRHFQEQAMLQVQHGIKSLDDIDEFQGLKSSNYSNFEAINCFLTNKGNIDLKKFLVHLNILFYPGHLMERFRNCLAIYSNGSRITKTSLCLLFQSILSDEMLNLEEIVGKLADSSDEDLKIDDVIKTVEERQMVIFKNYYSFFSEKKIPSVMHSDLVQAS